MQFGYSSGATNDLENQVLMAMGLGYANPGGSIAWQGPTSQGMVDAALNMAYARLCSDIGDIELLTQTLTIPTQPSVWSYTLQNTFGQPPTAIGSRATGSFIIGGKAAAGQTPSITINGHVINYTVLGTDTLSSVTQAFINLINANTVVTSGNQLAPVTPVLNALNTIGLLAQNPGTSGNYAISTNGGSGTITVTVSGATMLGGDCGESANPDLAPSVVSAARAALPLGVGAWSKAHLLGGAEPQDGRRVHAAVLLRNESGLLRNGPNASESGHLSWSVYRWRPDNGRVLPDHNGQSEHPSNAVGPAC